MDLVPPQNVAQTVSCLIRPWLREAQRMANSINMSRLHASVLHFLLMSRIFPGVSSAEMSRVSIPALVLADDGKLHAIRLLCADAGRYGRAVILMMIDPVTGGAIAVNEWCRAQGFIQPSRGKREDLWKHVLIANPSNPNQWMTLAYHYPAAIRHVITRGDAASIKQWCAVLLHQVGGACDQFSNLCGQLDMNRVWLNGVITIPALQTALIRDDSKVMPLHPQEAGAIDLFGVLTKGFASIQQHSVVTKGDTRNKESVLSWCISKVAEEVGNNAPANVVLGEPVASEAAVGAPEPPVELMLSGHIEPTTPSSSEPSISQPDAILMASPILKGQPTPRAPVTALRDCIDITGEEDSTMEQVEPAVSMPSPDPVYQAVVLESENNVPALDPVYQAVVLESEDDVPALVHAPMARASSIPVLPQQMIGAFQQLLQQLGSHVVPASQPAVPIIRSMQAKVVQKRQRALKAADDLDNTKRGKRGHYQCAAPSLLIRAVERKEERRGRPSLLPPNHPNASEYMRKRYASPDAIARWYAEHQVEQPDEATIARWTEERAAKRARHTA